MTGLICLSFLFSHSQSIDNRNWKAYLTAPINDTVTFHLNFDSSFITNSNGEVVIRLSCIITADTLTMVNQATNTAVPTKKEFMRSILRRMVLRLT